MTPRWVQYRMCEPCLALTEKAIKDLRFDWKLRLPVLYWADFRAIVTKVGDVKAVAKILNLTVLSTRQAMTRYSPRARIPPWMLRKIYAPLREKYATEWLKVLPTRCFLWRTSVQALKLQRAWFPDLSTDSSLALSSSQLLTSPGSFGGRGKRVRLPEWP